MTSISRSEAWVRAMMEEIQAAEGHAAYCRLQLDSVLSHLSIWVHNGWAVPELELRELRARLTDAEQAEKRAAQKRRKLASELQRQMKVKAEG